MCVCVFQVSRALTAARALVQGLAAGRDIVSKASKVSQYYCACVFVCLVCILLNSCVTESKCVCVFS